MIPNLPVRSLRFVSLAIGALSVVTAAGSAAGAATSTTRANATGFCNQVKASQGAIAKFSGVPKVKMKAIAGEWAKIERTAPARIKSEVMKVRAAYDTASRTGSDAAVRAKAVAIAGKAVTEFFSQRCSDRGPADGGDGAGREAFAAYRACLEKNGVSLPAPGQNPPGAAGGGIDRNDPKVAAALSACVNLLPAGGAGGGGGGRGGGRGNFAAIQDCLQDKGITLPRPAGAGGGGGQRPLLDAKTQAAVDACRQEATAPSTTIKKA